MRKIAFILIPALLYINVMFAQTKDVAGKVTDGTDGSGLAGVTVSAKNSKVSTITDSDGTFSIKVPPKTTTLVFSYVGFKSSEIKISSGVMSVSLTPGLDQLAEVIVTGYGTKIKREISGSIARVSGKDIENMPVASVDAALQGKAAGVFVNSQSGKLGQAVTVRIRGNSSISASSQPLYVVDGVPVTTNDQSSYGGETNPLSDINPNDY